jgi:phosphate transport system substrate-binding protein
MSKGRMAVVAVLMLALVGGGVAATYAADVTITGSTTVLPIAQAVAEALAGQIDVEVSGGGSSVGIAALLNGTTDIADHSRGIMPGEYAQFVKKGKYPFTFHVANDAITVVVHPGNPVSNLTLAQLKGIYSGKITNWKAVGGPDAPIVVVSRDNASGTYETWEALVMQGAAVTSGALYTTSNGDEANEVSMNKNAIGYVGLAYVTPQLKPVSVDGKVATMESAVNHTYPIARPLFMSTNGFPSGKVLNVILYILSDAGQRLVEQVGYAPIRVLPQDGS